MIPCSSDAYIKFHLACTASGCTWRRSKPNESGRDVIVEEGRDITGVCMRLCTRGRRQVKYEEYVMRIPNIQKSKVLQENATFTGASIARIFRFRGRKRRKKQTYASARKAMLCLRTSGTTGNLWRIYSTRGPRRAAIFPRPRYWSVKILIRLRMFLNVETRTGRREMQLIRVTIVTIKHS